MDVGEIVASGERHDTVSIREVEIDDAPAVARLTGELGYPAAVETMRARITALANLKDHVLYAACLDGRVLGWIDVRIVHHLQDEPYGEIAGLVVDRDFRSRGIGALLVAKCEQWTTARGVFNIRVRSRIERDAAHRFYLRLNYSRLKTSAVFVKAL
jgi:GNAT superfamily N-acetyltransferase